MGRMVDRLLKQVLSPYWMRACMASNHGPQAGGGQCEAQPHKGNQSKREGPGFERLSFTHATEFADDPETAVVHP